MLTCQGGMPCRFRFPETDKGDVVVQHGPVQADTPPELLVSTVPGKAWSGLGPLKLGLRGVARPQWPALGWTGMTSLRPHNGMARGSPARTNKHVGRCVTARAGKPIQTVCIRMVQSQRRHFWQMVPAFGSSPLKYLMPFLNRVATPPSCPRGNRQGGS